MICFSEAGNVGRVWDVLVVGAGVAGAMAAYGAARRGFSVLLIDKAAFPRGKACGCCLNQAAVNLLEEAQFKIRDLGATPIDRFYLACGGTTAKIPIPSGLAISREVLDMALINHAQKAGAIFMPRTTAQATAGFSTYREVSVVQDGNATSLRAKIVLVADGLGGRLLRDDDGLEIAANSRVGIAGTLDYPANDYAPGIIYMACGKRGYAGLVTVENQSLHIAAALDVHAARDAAGAGNAVAEIIRDSGLPVPEGLTTCRWHGAPALTRHRSILFEKRLFVLGDSAGYVEPFSGEGMAWALAGAKRILPLVEQAVRAWRDELGPQWQKQFRELVGSRQRICRAVTMSLRNGAITRLAVEALKISPALAGPLVRQINRPMATA